MPSVHNYQMPQSAWLKTEQNKNIILLILSEFHISIDEKKNKHNTKTATLEKTEDKRGSVRGGKKEELDR